MKFPGTLAYIAPLSLALSSCAAPYQEAEGLPADNVIAIRSLIQPLVQDHIALNADYHTQLQAGNCTYTLEDCPELRARVDVFRDKVVDVQTQVKDLLLAAGCEPWVTLTDLNSLEVHPNFTDYEDSSSHWVKVTDSFEGPDCQKDGL